jgi:hypothetical protein
VTRRRTANAIIVGLIPTSDSSQISIIQSQSPKTTQRSLTAEHQVHTLVDVGATPTAATKQKWCNGNTSVSKTDVLGSNPSFCVAEWPSLVL